MKKLIIAVILGTASISAAAQHRGYDWHHGHRHGGSRDWVAPLIVGGIAGAIIARESQRQDNERAVVVQTPPPVIVAPTPRVTQYNNIVIIDGIPYTRQIILVDGVYREIWVRQ